MISPTTAVRDSEIPHTEPIVRALAALAAVMVALFAAAAGWALFGNRPYAPLGPYPDQTITAVDTTAGTVSTIGTKCSDETVGIVGSFSLVAVDPPGRIIPLGSGTNVRLAGCHDYEYVNTLPPAFLLEETRTDRTWKLAGTETPTNGETLGIAITWQSDDFRYEDYEHGS